MIITLPQSITVIILIALSILSIIISNILYASDPYMSSIFSNIFAGLVTGIAICLISGIKQINAYKLEGTITWLRNIHKDCLKFLTHYRKTLLMFNEPTVSRENLYNEIYDVLCEGNDINIVISQSRFNKSLPFNPYKFFVNELGYDAIKHSDINEDVHDTIWSIDIDNMTELDIREIFKEMEHSLFLLNGSILAKISELEIKQNMANRFVF